MFKNESAQSQGIDTTSLFRVSDKESACFGELLRVIKVNVHERFASFKVLSSGQITTFSWDKVEYAEKSLDTLEVGDVLVDKDGGEGMVLGVCGKVYIMSYYNDFNISGIGLTLQEIKQKGWKLKNSKPEVLELTIDEIASKFGKQPNEIKIKK